ncbi:helix-turn-helix domain-containing protein [Loigolactobacillus backii]|uniref:helix-turn-helix domain-containing protein n=1 Tax=Loigolactobacillus backii TaxID=375175 RepID=UPI0007F0EAE1|nr:S24 family peptidase [Loigolactobacillus backii]ANK59853.1 hypothetical protein AYR52_06005 [Loigolactobacillus backii]
MEQPEFGMTIKKIRESKHFSVRQTALKAKMSPSYLSQIENGIHAIPTPKTLTKIAKGLNIPEKEIYEYAGLTIAESNGATNLKPFNDPSMESLPIYGTIKAGPGGFAYEDHQGTMPVSKSMLDLGHDYIWLRISGNSMIGDSIYDGDYALIDMDYEPECNGEILAVLYDDELATLKHVSKKDRTVVLSASNPIYPPIILSGIDLESFKVVGKPIVTQHRL